MRLSTSVPNISQPMIDRDIQFSVAYCICHKDNSQLVTDRLVEFSSCGINYSKNKITKIDFFGPNLRDVMFEGHHGWSLIDKVMGISRADWKSRYLFIIAGIKA